MSVKNISKKFRLFNSPQERFLEAFHPFNKKYHKEFWALRDVSFDIPKGQTVGIIGRNGSGKSTLLQVLCSILKPTSGKVVANGKIAALLELGAGFNPEFTGRQNVLVKGMLMGFSQKEMRERLPEIEAFADIGDFIDQPLKIYSSGMAVRLAFACAINVDPDILIIDEALAVGDARFQHKCYGKFKEFQDAGKTIVFVTHDIGSIVKHCNFAILLEKGVIVKKDKPGLVADEYTTTLFEDRNSAVLQKDTASPEGAMSFNSDATEIVLERFFSKTEIFDNCVNRRSYNKFETRSGDKRGLILDYLVVVDEECDPVLISSGSNVSLFVKVHFNEKNDNPFCGFLIKTKDGLPVFGTNNLMGNQTMLPMRKGDDAVVKFTFRMLLAEGDYFFNLGIGSGISNENVVQWDRRLSVVHVKIHNANQYKFDGLIDLRSACEVVPLKISK